MKVFVTGATGFLGRRIVAELLRRGHAVRVLVRPSSNLETLPWRDRVDVVRADLRAPSNLDGAFDGVDAVVHLAAAVTEPKDVLFSSTVVGTERLLAAMARSTAPRLILASSFAIYDWSEIGSELTEDSPLEADLYGRDEYTIAKFWQEKVAREWCRRNGRSLTVLRPGLIWGPGSEHLPAIGPSVGRTQFVIGPLRPLVLTYVDNCADCFVAAIERPRSIDETFNVVDDHNVSAWRYAGEQVSRSNHLTSRTPVPYVAGWAGVQLVSRTSNLVFKGKGKLPSLFVPCRFEARFMRARAPSTKLRDVLGWTAPYSFQDCLRRSDSVRLEQVGLQPAPIPVASQS